MNKVLVIYLLKNVIYDIELLKNTKVPTESLSDYSLRYKNILNLVYKTLNSTIEEISDNKKICSINSEVDKFEKSHGEILLMEEKIKILNDELDNFNKKMENETLESYCAIKENEEFIGKLKDHYEDSIYEFQIKEEFIKSWEMARLDQMLIKHKKKGEGIISTLQNFEQKHEWELRVHCEIIAFTEEIIKDTSKNISFWQDKYNAELEMYKQKIIGLKKKRSEQKEKFTNILKTFKDRENEMIQYAKFKEAKRLEAEKISFLNCKATKIQAWWRGVMVRRKLGPYKVKKPKGKSNKDIKKNKNK